LVESVLANLRRILNSRHGIAVAHPDYGIPDLTDLVHTFPEGVGGMQRAIKEAVEKYEPRLRRVIVKNAEAEDQLAMRFEIKAELASDDGKTPIRFETWIDADGEVEIKG